MTAANANWIATASYQSENGDEGYCPGCYHEHYTSCDGCSCELSRGSEAEYVGRRLHLLPRMF